MFNHLKHSCFHCGLFFSSTVPCVGIELVLAKPAVKLTTKQAALSNVVPVQVVTCPAEVAELDAIGCNVLSEPAAALECRVCEGADGANVWHQNRD